MAKPRLTLRTLLDRCVFVPRNHARLLLTDDSIFEERPGDDLTTAMLRDLVKLYRAYHERDDSGLGDAVARAEVADAVRYLIAADDPFNYACVFGLFTGHALAPCEDGRGFECCRCGACLSDALSRREEGVQEKLAEFEPEPPVEVHMPDGRTVFARISGRGVRLLGEAWA